MIPIIHRILLKLITLENPRLLREQRRSRQKKNRHSHFSSTRSRLAHAGNANSRGKLPPPSLTRAKPVSPSRKRDKYIRWASTACAKISLASLKVGWQRRRPTSAKKSRANTRTYTRGSLHFYRMYRATARVFVPCLLLSFSRVAGFMPSRAPASAIVGDIWRWSGYTNFIWALAKSWCARMCRRSCQRKFSYKKRFVMMRICQELRNTENDAGFMYVAFEIWLDFGIITECCFIISAI